MSRLRRSTRYTKMDSTAYKRAFNQGLRRLITPNKEDVFSWASRRQASGDIAIRKLLETAIFGPPEHFGAAVDELQLQNSLLLAPDDQFHIWLLETYRKRKPRQVYITVRMWWRFRKEENLLGQAAMILRLVEFWESRDV